jgi:hypothetical protein
VQARRVHEREPAQVQDDAASSGALCPPELGVDRSNGCHVEFAARRDHDVIAVPRDVAGEWLDVLRQHLPSDLLMKNKHDASKHRAWISASRRQSAPAPKPSTVARS